MTDTQFARGKDICLYDAIVVGAGPAGNNAAFKLAASGYDVAVLDWREDIGDKLCTGIIGNDCAKKYPPNADHIYHKAKSAVIVSPAGVRYQITRDETQAVIVNRVAFVDDLAKKAMNAGARYILGPRVSNIEVDEKAVTISTEIGRGGDKIQSKLVVIASGFGSPLLRMVDLEKGRQKSYMIGTQAEVESNDLESTEIYLGDHISPGSFGWLVPLSGSRALVGTVSRKSPNGHAGRFLSNLQSDGKIKSVLKPTATWGIPLQPIRKTYRDRVLVVGDAAGLVKPTTGGGIYYALLSGDVAADAAESALARDDFSARRLKSYESAWKQLIGNELRVGYIARVLFEALGDHQVEKLLRRIILGSAESDLISSGNFSFDRHSRTILQAVRHKELLPLFRSFGPAVAPALTNLIRSKLF